MMISNMYVLSILGNGVVHAVYDHSFGWWEEFDQVKYFLRIMPNDYMPNDSYAKRLYAMYYNGKHCRPTTNSHSSSLYVPLAEDYYRGNDTKVFILNVCSEKLYFTVALF